LSINAAIPWSLSHYIPLNGFHPLYRALLDQAPSTIKVSAWDNVALSKRLAEDPNLQVALTMAARENARLSKQADAKDLGSRHHDIVSPTDRVLLDLLAGDIEFHHTAPFPSFKRPFILHCESFAPIFFPFSRQGSGNFSGQKDIREYFKEIFSNPLCLGVFSHMPETLESLRKFFPYGEIEEKLINSRVGLSERAFEASLVRRARKKTIPTSGDVSFLFVNSQNQNIENFFRRGGHLVLRFWKIYRQSGHTGTLLLRSIKPDDRMLMEHGVDKVFLNAELKKSIIWEEDYLNEGEVNRLMAHAHFFLLPSRSLHSASILQAMTLGAVPVVTDTLGTSRYISDGEHGLVLQGVMKEIWTTDPHTGILFDQNDVPRPLEDAVVTQLAKKVIGLLESPDAYRMVREKAMDRVREDFSGKKFSQDFWRSVSSLYDKHLENASRRSAAPIELSNFVSDCLLSKKDLPRVFESATQPVRRLFTGMSVVWEFGGSFVHAYGSPDMKLDYWSPLFSYFEKKSPQLKFVKELEDLEGCFLELREKNDRRFRKRFIGFISRKLVAFPILHRIAFFILNLARSLYRELRRHRHFFNLRRRLAPYIHFISPKIKAGPGDREVSLIMQGIGGYNIVKYRQKIYAIPQGEGEFSLSKARKGGYTSILTGFTFNQVLRKIRRTAHRGKTQGILVGKWNPEPELVLEGFHEFNIVRIGHVFYAVRQSEGALDVRELTASRKFSRISATSLAEVKRRISMEVTST